MISLNQLSVSFGGTDHFKGISLLVPPKDRMGLVGKNGAGKTTLLRIICGLQEPTSGEVVIPSSCTLGYLPQTMNHQDGRTVIEEARTAFQEVLDVASELKKTQHQLSVQTDYESDEYLQLAHSLADLNERYHMLGGASIDADIERTLCGLGFQPSEFNRSTKELSGGWRMRIELAKILLQKPDVLLLDEPTNHLDIESIQWLEQYLKDFPGALILISHDRAFLDNTTRRTVEISLGKVYDYKVSYSAYVRLRQERHEQQMATYRNQQKTIQDTEEFIERFRYKATKAVQVQSRIKQLEKIDRIEVDEFDTSTMHVRFPSAPRSGKVVVEANHLTKRFGEKTILNNIHLKVHRGEKIAFAGRNGEGKTTLLRLIVGELTPEEGTLETGHNVRIGYYAQNQHEILDEQRTAFETIDEVAVGDVRTKIRDLMGAFLFSGEDVDKKVRVLSGGERSRLAMIKLLLEPYNLLILDEPTNHFDMRSKEVLKQALMNYDGTLIVVSHDRDFLSGLTEKVFEFRDKNVKEHLGDIYEFLEKKNMASLQEVSRRRIAPVEESGEVKGKRDYLDKKEFEKKVRKATTLVQQSESIIEKLESKIKEVEKKISEMPQEKIHELSQFYYEHLDLKKKLEKEMSLWEERTDALEKTKNS